MEGTNKPSMRAIESNRRSRTESEDASPKIVNQRFFTYQNLSFRSKTVFDWGYVSRTSFSIRDDEFLMDSPSDISHVFKMMGLVAFIYSIADATFLHYL